jgi:site-specific DNA-methyltransferase (cytosine-N4-specific)
MLSGIPDGKVNLIMTSPPYALTKAKAYGNVTASEYRNWFAKFVPEFKRVLADDGSLVINIGGAWEAGRPTRSVYHYALLLDLVNDGFHLAQDFFWYNPAKIPNPAQWVNIERCRVKDAVEPIWWLSKIPKPHADNRKVLTAYSASMKNLFKNGYNAGLRPSGWDVDPESWKADNGGAIPPNFLSEEILGNVLALANTDSQSRYLTECRRHGVPAHPARFPRGLPEFFIRFLTRENDIVLDPFAGSNLTGEVAEATGRRWIAVDADAKYLSASGWRFEKLLRAPPSPVTPPGQSFCGI